MGSPGFHKSAAINATALDAVGCDRAKYPTLCPLHDLLGCILGDQVSRTCMAVGCLREEVHGVDPVGEAVGSILIDKYKVGLWETCGPVNPRSKGHNDCAPQVDIYTSTARKEW